MMLIRNKLPFILMVLAVNNVYAEDFEANGSVQFTQTFYGNSGPYKTATGHPNFIVNYNFSPKWSAEFEWNRTWNMYDYDGGGKQQDNSYSSPELTVSYNYGVLGASDIKWNSSLTLQNENSFDDTNQTYVLAQTAFDLSDKIPKSKYLEATQFSISPMYIYGWNTQGPSSHSNTGVLSLLTNFDITPNLSWTFNAYALRSWSRGETFSATENGSSDTMNYFMVISYLNYSHDLYKFNEKVSLDFNFTGGFDPWISSNKRTTVEPFLVSNQMYEWLGPTVMNGSYKNTFAFFALPQLNISYDYDKSLSFNFFVQAKFANQVWGDSEKGWELQPQAGFGLVHNF